MEDEIQYRGQEEDVMTSWSKQTSMSHTFTFALMRERYPRTTSANPIPPLTRPESY